MRDLQHGEADIAFYCIFTCTNIYIYVHGTNKFLVETMALEGGLSFFRWNILRGRVEFFFKASQESKHLLVGCYTKLVPVDVRVLLPRLHACACAYNKRSSTPGSVFFNQSGSASILSLSRFLNRSCSSSSMEHFVKKYKAFT